MIRDLIHDYAWDNVFLSERETIKMNIAFVLNEAHFYVHDIHLRGALNSMFDPCEIEIDSLEVDDSETYEHKIVGRATPHVVVDRKLILKFTVFGYYNNLNFTTIAVASQVDIEKIMDQNGNVILFDTVDVNDWLNPKMVPDD